MNYYYAKNEEKIGPLSLDELKKIELKKDTLVWHEGLDDWVKAEEVKELRVLFNEESKNNSIKDTKRKITKNQKIILINIFLFYLFFILFSLPNSRYSYNPFTNFNTFLNSFAENIGTTIVFYIALIISIFKRFETKTWWIIIAISWLTSLMALIGSR
tara:strand:- start:372 stop:845 length:474 start_codon:yes stop_codon:yes gene_type:complete